MALDSLGLHHISNIREPGCQLGSRPELLDLHAAPELQVLLTELCLQEGVEGGHSIWGCRERGRDRSDSGTASRSKEEETAIVVKGSILGM